MKLLIRNTQPHSFVSDAYTPTGDELLVPALPRLQLSDYTPAIITNQLPAKDAGLFRIKVQAKEMIDELQWRIERAQERAKIGASGESVAQVLAEREAIRRASNRAELEIKALDDLEAIMDFTWEVTPEDYPVSTLVTRLAFLSRFTDAEAVAIDLASIGETMEAASVRRYVSKIETASFIDLSREDTRSGVQSLEGLGILVAGRALEILDAPIQPHEVPQ